MGYGKFNYINTLTVLIGKKMTLQGFEHWTSYSDTMLNHQMTQKLKLMGYDNLIISTLKQIKK